MYSPITIKARITSSPLYGIVLVAKVTTNTTLDYDDEHTAQLERAAVKLGTATVSDAFAEALRTVTGLVGDIEVRGRQRDGVLLIAEQLDEHIVMGIDAAAVAAVAADLIERTGFVKVWMDRSL
ncbi:MULTISPECIES: hypothetical protein [Cryobacterium]|uniref:Uncharacterized protein n=1 Tax=Cryobacterium glucosi TaxID=1259175 RepID=A0ABY2IQQ8_9MICO|nr:MULTISPECIES: hypothetical protein [Cryobacterium]TFB99716.1 hypothetical protein E3O39_02950 [Cryobacterium sp. MDB2-A-1]TFC09699.1 hypothetical protein E3O35_14140 [Cryobacterium sp. MDB2-A-2]TFC22675.1 hypothetical protein E3O46_04360 [Cryobacterium glucosi]TFC23969.1 hypothetical protein E3O51_00145 [Cryobacterium sp. MDB2-10]